MGVKYTGTAVFKSGLEIQGKFPLDSRTVIDSAEDLVNYKSLFTLGGVGSWYPGMTVVALDTKKLYVLASEEEGFVEVSGSIDNSGSTIIFNYKGTVSNFSELPIINSPGDVYNVESEFTIEKTIGEGEGATTVSKKYPAGTNVAWAGTDWDPLGGSVDLSNYITQQTYQGLATTVASNTTIAESAYQLATAANTEVQNKVDKEEGYRLISEDELNLISQNGAAISTLISIDAGNRLQALEDNIGTTSISTLVADVGSLKTTVATKADASTVDELSEDLTALNGTVTGIQGQVAELITKDTEITGELGTLKTTVNQNGSAIVQLNTNYTNLSGRVDTVESELTTLKSTGIQEIVDTAINNFATTVTDNDTIDTFKELVDFAATHKDIATTITNVTANSSAISTLNGDVNTQGSVKHSIKTEIDALRDEIGGATSDALEWKIVTDPEEPETTE